MMFKLAQSASKKWRRFNCHEKITVASEGKMSAEGAKQYIKQLADEGRYSRDVY